MPAAPPAQAVGVLNLTAIVVGESRRLPIPLPILGGRTLGSASAVQQIRNARRTPASPQSWRTSIQAAVPPSPATHLARVGLLNQEKPVVVYMGDVAASGVLHRRTARRIVAQPAT